MTKKIIIMLAVTTLFVSGCGKSGYKAAKPNSSGQAAEVLNDTVEATIEEKAETLLSQDTLFASARDSSSSDILKEETLGITARISAVDQKTIIEVSHLSSQHVDCKEKTSRLEIETAKLTSLQNFPGVGRVSCVDTTCEHLLVLIESRQLVKSQDDENDSMKIGSVSVLMKRDEAGVHKPVTTQSTQFLQINDVETAVQACVDQAAADKVRADQVAATERARAQQQLDGALKLEQEKRLSDLNLRIQQIDKELSRYDAPSMSPDVKRIMTAPLKEQKETLVKERDDIKSALAAQKAAEAALDPQKTGAH